MSGPFGSSQLFLYPSGIAYLGDRAVVAGGVIVGSTVIDDIDYFSIGTLGNASDFGELQGNTYQTAGLSSGSRGVFVAGWVGAYSNRIDYITIASTGNASDFGNATTTCSGNFGTSDGTRGVYGSGSGQSSNYSNHIEHITIASTGNGADFGNLVSDAASRAPSSCSGD